METLLISLILGFGIGGSLGLLGGGGSILTVPALVYLVGQTPQVAVTTSLVIVGMNSAVGVFFHRARGTLNWRVAVVFGGAGMATAYLAASLSEAFPASLLMVLFALLMLLVGGLMLLRRLRFGGPPAEPKLWKVIASGVVVGLLTGLLGVGGGFLIVPALVMLVGIPMHHAVGTSLVIIVMNSLAGFLGHRGHVVLDMPVIVVFVVAGLAGTFAGTSLGSRLNPALLRRIFAILIVGLSLFLLADNLPGLLP